MSVYSITKPLLKGSSKKIEITDESGNIVGYISRCYKNRRQKYLDTLFNNTFITNIQGFDIDNKMTCEINEKFGLKQFLKSEWDGYSNFLGDFSIKDQTKIKTNPRVVVLINNKQLKIKKDLGDKRVIFENDTGNIIAEASYENLTSARQIFLNINTKEFTHIEVASLYYLFDLKD
ncbi:tubby C-terminal domain-like protein [Bacillus xiapuensis]|uniref:tubby C-terminal domain-like protein n=1 Tax=Bacillus xiapuensis TaxID=2014075 RepID=UPI000C247D3A|nr:hypothetical protein [Bacillus xiapuensis]